MNDSSLATYITIPTFQMNLMKDNFTAGGLQAHTNHSELKPILQGICKLSDLVAVQTLKNVFDCTGVDSLVQRYRDVEGNTLLHLASTASMPHSVQWLLSHVPSLAQEQNRRLQTPLQAFQILLDGGRVWGDAPADAVDISDRFAGYSEKSILILWLLSTASHISCPQMECLKFGCTCGTCLQGFLSPRMCLALEWQARRLATLLRDEIQSGSSWVGLNAEYLKLAPNGLQSQLSRRRAMREGFAAIAGHIAVCLQNHEVPTEENVRKTVVMSREWPPISDNYLYTGGTVFPVAAIVFGETRASEYYLCEEHHLRDVECLPTCRNDHEFGFVGSMCGYSLFGSI